VEAVIVNVCCSMLNAKELAAFSIQHSAFGVDTPAHA
jgi:hypothetical protein